MESAATRTGTTKNLAASHFQDSLQQAIGLFQTLEPLEATLNKAADMVSKCLIGGNKLLVCGNGGSASDSAHFATEYLCRFNQDRRPYPALSLTSEGSLMTAVGNDYHFEDVFARQIWGLGQKGDVIIALSTSGKSKNILKGLEESKKRGLESIAFLGRDGGFCKGMATIDLIVPGDNTARIQEAHKFLFHVLCEIVEKTLPKN
jgi:phosphoheptose isomerase